MPDEQTYPLDSEKVYFSMDLLSLEDEEGTKTMRLGAWLNYDPVRIHRMVVREKNLKVDEIEVMNPLMSKLRRADPEYYKRYMGLSLIIDYPGYSSGVVARIPYENDPVGFYKWWRKGKHEDKVHLSMGWQIKLFQKVSMMDPKMILRKDYELVR